MSYTYIFNNAFLDFCIQYKILVDLAGRQIEVLNGGEQFFTATPLPFVAKGVVAVLQRPEETANRIVRLHGASLTQRKLLEISKRVVGEDGWTVKQSKAENVGREAYENLKKDPGNFMGWGIGFLKLAIFGEEYGGDFSKNHDNEVLGLKETNEEEIEGIVRQYAP